METSIQRIALVAVIVALTAAGAVGYRMLAAQRETIDRLQDELAASNARQSRLAETVAASEPVTSPALPAATDADRATDSDQAADSNPALEEAVAQHDAALRDLQAAVAELQKEVGRTLPIMRSVARDMTDPALQPQIPPDQYIPTAEEIPDIQAHLMSRDLSISEKLMLLRQLRNADARSAEVANHMASAYYETESGNARADIFRQLDGVVTPDLREALLSAVANDTEPDVREEAAETMAHFLPDDEVQEWLEYLAENDSDRDVRAQANHSLRELSQTVVQ